MSFTLAIKVGSQPGIMACKEGMPVSMYPDDEPFSSHMKTVFAIVRLKDSDRALVIDAMTPLVAFRKPAMACRKYFDLDVLAMLGGDAKLADRWRTQGLEVPILDAREIDITKALMPSENHKFPMGDLNAVTTGTYTVGTAGSYSNWTAARADIGTPLTGNLTFNQISATSEGAIGAQTSVNLAGFTLTCNSNSPHNGDPTQGYAINLDIVTSADVFFMSLSGTAGAGLLEIKNLKFKYNSNIPTTSSYLIRITTAGPNVSVHDILADTSSSPTYAYSDISVVPASGASASTLVKIWNCALKMGGFATDYGIILGLGGYTATYTVENVTILAGRIVSSSSAITCRNVGVFDGNTSCFVTMTTSTGRNNISSDASAANANWSVGTDNLTNKASANQFLSTSFTSPNFLRLKSTGDCASAGIAPGLVENTIGIRGNARPRTVGVYSVGADELLLPPVVISCAPPSGPVGVSTSVSIAGTGFVVGATVTFGGVAAGAIVVSNPNLITCDTPALPAAGPVDIVVTNDDTQSGTLNDGFEYTSGSAPGSAGGAGMGIPTAAVIAPSMGY